MSKKIYLSPSDQTRNAYAWGNTTEAEQCRRISDACAQKLEEAGFDVKNVKSGDMFSRVAESVSWNADLHVCIHSNSCNGQVAGTRAFAWDMQGEGYKATKAIFDVVAPVTPGESENIKADPELYEIKRTSCPCAYIEVDFHDVPDVARWIVEHTKEIGQAIAEGICNYFGVEEEEPETVETVNNEREVIEMKLPVLKRGDKSPIVHAAMVLLKELGYYEGTCDDLFGPRMEAGVIQAQKDHGFGADGAIGYQMWPLLLRVNQ